MKAFTFKLINIVASFAFSFYLIETGYYYFFHNPTYNFSLWPNGYGYTKPHKTLGVIGNGKKNIRVIRSRKKKLIADATYNMENEFRAVPPVQTEKVFTNKGKFENFIFYGGSYMFGLGLDDKETLPYFFQSKHPNTNVFNLGIPGWGVHQLLLLLQNSKVDSYISESNNSTLVYGFMTDHLNRASHSFAVLSYIPWSSSTPSYREVNGKLRYLGSYENAFPFTSKAGLLLNESFVLKKLLSYTLNFNHKQKERLFCKIISSISQELKKKKVNFIIFSYEELNNSGSLVKCFSKYSKFIKFNKGLSVNNKTYRIHDLDLHPNRYFNKKASDHLSVNLAIH